MQNVSELPVYPATLLFFRRHVGNCVTSWNPVFEILDFRRIVVDVLHTLVLGVSQYYAGTVFALVLREDLLGSGHANMEARIKVGVLRMQKELDDYYHTPEGKRVERSTV